MTPGACDCGVCDAIRALLRDAEIRSARAARVERFRERLARVTAAELSARQAPTPPPRYDGVFVEGVAWLDQEG